ncbi:branched-chain amino acid aminotransferase [Sporosarcina limicola]|uniref:Branched-chain amino acid aminotransferase n=1 Tax=Sporosarcina limicola TaxID=34101 RepID=A0A927MIT0_9BACL|nr:branched-chain amino acid aminotransferase [Sporosarcina limicola]MBE1555383.1 hypothetical protein [Sporosarcina limicola]
MLNKQMTNYIANNVNNNEIELNNFEKVYAEKHQLVPQDVTIVDKGFHTSVIERCNKETEEVIRTETDNFLNESASYLKKNLNEFLFVESNTFEIIGVDGIALEFDDVFETYTALFGLKLQKKYGPAIKAFLDTHLQGDNTKYSVMFSGEDGLWDMNFALSYIEGFNDELSFEQVLKMVYLFIFKLSEAVEDDK